MSPFGVLRNAMRLMLMAPLLLYARQAAGGSAPQVELFAPATVAAGSGFRISWTSSGTSGGGSTPCVPSGGSSTAWPVLGAQPPQGHADLQAPAAAATLVFTLSCSNALLTGSDSVQVAVPVPVMAPELVFAPTPGSLIEYGADGLASAIVVTPLGGSGSGPAATTTLDGCAIAGPAAAFPAAPIAALQFPAGNSAPQALALPRCVPQAELASALLSCSQSSPGTATQARSWPLHCPAAPTAPVPVVVLNVAPEFVASPGAGLQLGWSSTHATTCAPSGGLGTAWAEQNPLPTSGFFNLALAGNAVPGFIEFALACSGPGGTGSSSAILRFGAPPPPPAAPLAVASNAADGTPANGASGAPALSDRGRFVAFESAASNLVPGDSNQRPDIFVRDSASGQLSRVSLDEDGNQSSLLATEPSISADGSVVVYTRGSALLPAAPGSSAKATVANGQVCARLGGRTVCLSVPPGGGSANGASGLGGIAPLAPRVAFQSAATNLAASDANGSQTDVYVVDLPATPGGPGGVPKRINVNAAGVQGNGPATDPALSCNGEWLAYASSASNLSTTPIMAGLDQVFLARVAAVGAQLASLPPGGGMANGASSAPQASSDGQHVYYESDASNLVPGDSNGMRDIFRTTVASGATIRLSVASDGTQANGPSRNVRISCDGRYASFESSASNLVLPDDNGRSDTFVRDMQTGVLVRSSQPLLGGIAANGSSSAAALAPDGSAVGFASDAANLGASAGQPVVLAGANPFVARNYTGAWFDPQQSGHGLFVEHLPDQRLLAWWFTFDPEGRQAWFGGVGPIAGGSARIAVTRTDGPGGRFIPNFDAAAVQNAGFGTLALQFDGCSSGRVEFDLGGNFGRGGMDLTRLSIPADTGCRDGRGSTPAAQLPAWLQAAAGPAQRAGTGPKRASGPVAQATGAWYDPLQSGHGLFIESLPGDQLLAWWFTFGPNGGQAWFGAVGTINGNGADFTALQTTGGRWIPNFDATQVSHPALGSMRIEFSDCNSGRVDFGFGQGFGTGSMPLLRLTTPLGQSCR